MHITFKEYLESKTWLKEKAQDDSTVSSDHSVKTYCKLQTGEGLAERIELNLKPNTVLSVNWVKEGKGYICESVTIENAKFSIYWKTTKLNKWLSSNTELAKKER